MAWRETAATLLLWTQIVGKVRLSLTPWLNHSWHVPLYVTARGLGSSPISAGGELFEMEFDFIEHLLVCRGSTGAAGAVALVPQTVADFYARVMAMLGGLGILVTIDTMPSEIADAVRFEDDVVHKAYDADAAHRFWRALVQADRVFKLFRTGFLGKASPVHFFWGSFDLAVTRFSGRRAPLHPGGVPGLPDRVTREAYSHEVSSAGFWPGSDAFPEAAFYSYAYPTPPGFRDAAMPDGARFDAALGEFVLPYAMVREAADPDGVLLAFLDASYESAANAGGWDRASLECARGVPGEPRRLDWGSSSFLKKRTKKLLLSLAALK
jgi:hypothetical protein